MTELSEQDRSVLSFIFDGDDGELHVKENPDRTSLVALYGEEAILKAKELEKSAIIQAENNEFQAAFATIAEAIKLAERDPSLYNNRAQIHQLNRDKEAAMKDLDQAICLSEELNHQDVSALAYTQRGILRKAEGDEDGALADFTRAAELGNPFAKKEAVKLNPMAKLCNAMLQESLAKLYGKD
eukprot:TRINITY_DN628_c0_g1_i1.p1 TRINITY_DN628_c0_g1~~TRINITY_DN628_c0_g1_i1.p1  ORF type:complete len:184 (-),score=47.62 TRINITY_DN628_c0_g1_i1:508-1059(-)